MDDDHEWLRTQETVNPEHITVALRGRPGMTGEEWEEMWRSRKGVALKRHLSSEVLL